MALLGKPRGNRGEITAVALTSHPERFAALGEVRLVGEDDTVREARVEHVWDHGGIFIFQFAGIDSIDAAEALRGFEVQVPKSERVALEPGEYFLDDLVGCEMCDAVSGHVYGKVTGYEEYGGPVLLSVDAGRILVPFVKAICVDIRPEERVIGVQLPEGLDRLQQP